MALLLFSGQYLPALAVLLILGRLAYNRYGHGIQKYPGPFVASLTDLWHLWDYARRLMLNDTEPELVKQHRKYGDIIRIKPYQLLFAQPQAIRDIYGPGKNWEKSEMYEVAAAVVKGRCSPTLFSSTDQQFHNTLRRHVNNAFSLTSVLAYESGVDETIQVLLQQLRTRFARTGIPFDLQPWMHYYALDVVGQVVYSSRYGYLETGTDFEGTMRQMQDNLDYTEMFFRAPWLDHWLKKNPVLLWLGRHGWINATNSLVPKAMRSQASRLKAYARGDKSKDDPRVDLLDRFIHAKLEHPESMTDDHILRLGLSMIFAGSDSTMASLTAFFYYVLKNPNIKTRLIAEMDSLTSLSFSEASKLPYLDACVKETFRIHPAARFAPERIVPAGGATICGEEIPAGTVVGVNAWVVHRNRDVFGEDVDVYRPERWLEDAEKTAEMNRTMHHFGAGSHMCIGKNISFLEMYKALPAMFRDFEIDLVDPEREWTWRSGTFVTPKDVIVRIKERNVAKVG